MDSRKKEIIALLTVTIVAVAAIGIGVIRNQARKSEPTKATEQAVDRFAPTSEVESVLISHVKTAFEEPVPIEPHETVIETVEPVDNLSPEYNGQGAVGWTFPEAFADARLKLGPGQTFIWNSQPFTTFYAEELSILAGDRLAAADSLQPVEKADTTSSEEE